MFLLIDQHRKPACCRVPACPSGDRSAFAAPARSGTRFVALAFALLLLCSASLLPADETEQVDRFLSRLGLSDLHILHLERSLEQPLGEQAQLQLARRLADLYASRLMETADQPDRYQELLAGIERLTSRFPQANTTALEVMLLQADYNRAEKLVGQWIADREQTQARQDAQAILVRIAPRLQSHQEELTGKVDKLFEEIGELPDGDVRDEKESELNRVQGVAGRSTYFAGWSNYYLGLTREDPVSTGDDFRRARDVFQKVLGLTDEDTSYEKVETAWLGLESPWRARSVIGLGLSEAALGNLSGSAQVFTWLESTAVAPDIRDQAAYWHVQGLINAREYTEAESYARERIDTFTGAASQGKISLCVVLIRTGHATGAGKAARELGPLGIAGLTRMRQFGALKTLIDRYKIDLSRQHDFYSLWIRGQQAFDAAEKSQAASPAKAAEQYAAASELFTKALASEQAARDVASKAQCLYNRGWARYRRANYLAAAKDFEQAITGLKSFDTDTAVQSAWLAHACHRQLIATSPTAANAAIGILERIKRDFPDSSFAQRADYQIARLRTSAASPEESIAALKRIAPDEENYLAARYDLCHLLHRQWQAAGKDARLAAERFDELQQAVDVYLAAAGSDEPQRRLSCVLKVIDAALASSSPQASVAARYLQAADQFVAPLPASDTNLPDYHYQHLKLARLKGDAAARAQHARWLVENAAGSRYELAALVNMATALDAQIKTAPPEQIGDLRSQAYDVYTRLATRLGDAPDVLANQKNARVAQSKRAYFAEQLGRHSEAAAALEKLLAAYPKDRDYLRRAALALYRSGQFEASSLHWNTLLRGLPAGSDQWLEAKYHQIACLGETDQATAAKVYKQFQLLYPELGGSAWQSKFQELKRRLD